MQMRDKGGKGSNFLSRNEFLKMYLSGETETLFDRYDRHDTLVIKDRLIYAHVDDSAEESASYAAGEYDDPSYICHMSPTEVQLRKAIEEEERERAERQAAALAAAKRRSRQTYHDCDDTDSDEDGLSAIHEDAEGEDGMAKAVAVVMMGMAATIHRHLTLLQMRTMTR